MFKARNLAAVLALLLAPLSLEPRSLEPLPLTTLSFTTPSFTTLSFGQEGGLNEQEEAKSKATARLTAAERSQETGEQLRQHQDFSLATSRDDNLASTWQRAQQLLQTARDALRSADASPSASAFRDAGILANGSRRAFEDFSGRAQRALRAIEKEREPPPPPPPPKPVPIPVPVETKPSTPAEGPRDATPSSTPGTEARSTSTSSSKPPPTSAPRTRSASQRLTSAPPPLRRAIDAFFQGEDSKVLDELKNPNNLGAGLQKAHALMLRAAARYHLYLLGGERDYAQRSAAVEDVLACRRVSPELEPPGELFSPRFIDFFNGTQ